MKTTIKILILNFLFIIINSIQAQPLNGNYFIGTSGDYTSLTQALTAIKTNGKDGQVILTIMKTYAASNETFPIVIDSTASNETYPLIIGLDVDATNITIGSSASSVFKFDGANWVTINGTSDGMNQDLTLMNTATGLGSTIEFINGSSNNYIQNCQLQSSSSVTNNATVLFSTSSTGIGNRYNKIANCKINNAMGKPYAAILSSGTLGADNSSNIVYNCELADFNNYGINLQSNSGNDWEISYNHFYATQISSAQTSAITIVSPTSNNIKILSNHIGGATTNCDGNQWNQSAANIAMIYLNVGATTPTQIEGNIISNINFSNSGTSTAMLVNVVGGLVNIGDVESNYFGYSDTINFIFAGTGTFTAINGLANSIQNNYFSGFSATSNFASARLVAIESSAPIIENNEIKKLYYNGSFQLPTPGLCGISSTATVSNTSIKKNKIYDLYLTHPVDAVTIGIDAINLNATSAQTIIQENKIYSLIPNSANSIVRGMFISKGKCDIINNMISLGVASDYSTIKFASTIIGINKQSTEDLNLFHNSIKIAGTYDTISNKNTTCFMGGPVTTASIIKNNLFSNTRTFTSGMYKNSCVDLKYGAPYYVINYNNYDTLGANAVFGFVNMTPYSDFNTYKTACGGEANGYHVDPGFYGDLDLYIQEGKYLDGDKTVPVYTDIDGNPRIKNQLGADEYLVPTVEAAFSYVIDTAKLKVMFTDTTAGVYTTWTWDFGDATTSSLQNPTHTYKQSGAYWVKLSIYNDTNGVAGTAQYFIEVGDVSCYASFSLATSPGNTITTTNYSFHSEGDTLQYLWNFGDEAISNKYEPIYKFNKQGMYNVSLTVVNDKRTCVQIYSEEIKVGTGNCNSFFNFKIDTSTNTVTCMPENNDLTAMYYWEFGDGNYSMDKSPQYAYPNPGYFQISLMIYDTVNQCAQSWSDVVMMYSKGNDCQAGFSYFQDSLPNVLQFIDYSATLNEHTVVWDFGTGDTSHVANPVYAYKEGGYYTVCLSITDNITKCKNTYCNVIPVGMEYFGVANACKAMYKSFIDTTTKTVSFIDVSIGSRTSYYWDFGDGSTSIEPNPKHTYTDKGYYSVYLWIQDSLTGFGSDYFDVINVNNGDNGLFPAFMWKADSTIPVKGVLPVEFKGASYGDASEVDWDFGDGTTNNSTIAPTHEYTSDGDFNVCYTVKDPIIGDSATVCDTIKIMVTSIKNEKLKIKNEEFSIYPNPANQSLVVSMQSLVNTNTENKITITNAIGQVVFHSTFNIYNSTFKVEVSQFESGVYFVRIGNVVKKLIVRK